MRSITLRPAPHTFGASLFLWALKGASWAAGARGRGGDLPQIFDGDGEAGGRYDPAQEAPARNGGARSMRQV